MLTGRMKAPRRSFFWAMASILPRPAPTTRRVRREELIRSIRTLFYRTDYRTFVGGPSSKRWVALFQVSGTWHVFAVVAPHWPPLLPSETVLPRISTPRA